MNVTAITAAVLLSTVIHANAGLLLCKGLNTKQSTYESRIEQQCSDDTRRQLSGIEGLVGPVQVAVMLKSCLADSLRRAQDVGELPQDQCRVPIR